MTPLIIITKCFPQHLSNVTLYRRLHDTLLVSTDSVNNLVQTALSVAAILSHEILRVSEYESADCDVTLKSRISVRSLLVFTINHLQPIHEFVSFKQRRIFRLADVVYDVITAQSAVLQVIAINTPLSRSAVSLSITYLVQLVLRYPKCELPLHFELEVGCGNHREHELR